VVSIAIGGLGDIISYFMNPAGGAYFPGFTISGMITGLLYGILKGMAPDKATQFGWACGALATTVLEDYATPADEEMVWSIYEGNARVKR